jgi:hypothetical protein
MQVITTKYKRIMERKLRRSDFRDAKAKEKAESEADYLAPVTPLLITLTKSLGEIPSGSCLQMPHDAAIALIHLGRATAQPVGDFKVQPDMVLTEDILRVCLPPVLFERLENLCESEVEAVCT